MFFVDKYAPKKPEHVMFHKKKIEELKKMSQDESIPHIIFHGPEGAGKKTLIKLFLEMLYDSDVNKLTESIYTVAGSGNNTKEITIKQSNYHIIIEPNNNNFDRYLIQDIVKEYAKKIPLGVFNSKKSFKTVLINNVGNMSYYAQTSLRRTMEKFSGTCRFIMWCRSLSRVIEPLLSRCYCFRIASPSDVEMLSMCMNIAFKESITLNLKEYTKIITKSNGNIKKALWMLQLKKNGNKYNTSYDIAINKIINYILTINISNITHIRNILYDIMITNIAGSQIIKDITENLLVSKTILDDNKLNIIEIATKYEHNLIRGRREIIHLEAFIVNIIHLFTKNHIYTT